MTQHAEALVQMPEQRICAIFGSVDTMMAATAIPDEPVRVSDARVKPYLAIADAFGSGARTQWARDALPYGGLNVWAGAMDLGRQAIAEAAGIDPREFGQTLNGIWTTFAREQSMQTPDPLDAHELDREIGLRLAFDEYPMETTVGFGGTNDEEISSRALGYVTPALQFAQAIGSGGGKPPVVRVFSAHELSTRVNGLDSAIAERTARKTLRLVQAYATTYFPDVPTEFTMPTLKSIQASLANMGVNGNALHLLRETVATSPELTDTVDTLMSIGASKGSSPSASAHYILSHLAPEVFSTVVDTAEGKVSSIKGGGPSEGHFTKLQRAVAARIQPHAPNLSRTHAYVRPAIPGQSGPRQIAIPGRGHKTPPYYRAAHANDIVIRPDGSAWQANSDKKPDRDTSLAMRVVGGRKALVQFMLTNVTQGERN